MYIPVGSIVKDETDVRQYCVGRDVTVRSCWFNDTKQFDVSEYYLSYSSIRSREYTIYCEAIEDGFKVVKVHRWR